MNFTEKLKRTLFSRQFVQLLGERVQFPHEVSQSKHLRPYLYVKSGQESKHCNKL
jgi:hypothetical protein